ncbi:hypothetical protein HY641_00010 [Candidatus Woesearchaeota archaeon]|nr:hypothetical protein [Candidatus Woesearchaeota archaeon]
MEKPLACIFGTYYCNQDRLLGSDSNLEDYASPALEAALETSMTILRVGLPLDRNILRHHKDLTESTLEVALNRYASLGIKSREVATALRKDIMPDLRRLTPKLRAYENPLALETGSSPFTYESFDKEIGAGLIRGDIQRAVAAVDADVRTRLRRMHGLADRIRSDMPYDLTVIASPDDLYLGDLLRQTHNVMTFFPSCEYTTTFLSRLKQEYANEGHVVVETMVRAAAELQMVSMLVRSGMLVKTASQRANYVAGRVPALVLEPFMEAGGLKDEVLRSVWAGIQRQLRDAHAPPILDVAATPACVSSFVH